MLQIYKQMDLKLTSKRFMLNVNTTSKVNKSSKVSKESKASKVGKVSKTSKASSASLNLEVKF